MYIPKVHALAENLVPNAVVLRVGTFGSCLGLKGSVLMNELIHSWINGLSKEWVSYHKSGPVIKASLANSHEPPHHMMTYATSTLCRASPPGKRPSPDMAPKSWMSQPPELKDISYFLWKFPVSSTRLYQKEADWDKILLDNFFLFISIVSETPQFSSLVTWTHPWKFAATSSSSQRYLSANTLSVSFITVSPAPRTAPGAQ